MGIRQQSRIIASNSKRMAFIGNGLEEAIAAKVEQHELILRDQILRGHPDAIHKFASGPPEVANPTKSWLDAFQSIRPLIQTGHTQELIEVTALDRGVADYHF